MHANDDVVVVLHCVMVAGWRAGCRVSRWGSVVACRIDCSPELSWVVEAFDVIAVAGDRRFNGRLRVAICQHQIHPRAARILGSDLEAAHAALGADVDDR